MRRKKAEIGDVIVLENGDKYRLSMLGKNEFCTIDIKNSEIVTSGYLLSEGDLSLFDVGEKTFGHNIDRITIVDIIKNI